MRKSTLSFAATLGLSALLALSAVAGPAITAHAADGDDTSSSVNVETRDLTFERNIKVVFHDDEGAELFSREYNYSSLFGKGPTFSEVLDAFNTETNNQYEDVVWAERDGLPLESDDVMKSTYSDDRVYVYDLYEYYAGELTYSFVDAETDEGLGEVTVHQGDLFLEKYEEEHGKPEKEGLLFDVYAWEDDETNARLSITTRTASPDDVEHDYTVAVHFRDYAKVTFNYQKVVNGVMSTVQNVSLGDSATPIDEPVYENFDFTGWYTNKECTLPYDFEQAVTSDITLYAGWVKSAYTVTFDFGDASGAEDFTTTVKAGETVTAPDEPAYEGHSIAGWYTDPSFETSYDFTTPVETDLTLYAKWVEDLTVTFDYGDGETKEVQVKYNGTVAKPETPQREHFTFGAWYSDEGCTEKFDFNTHITEDCTLYASWHENPTITFYSAASYDGVDDPNVWRTVEVPYGKSYAKPENPTLDGYTFINWYTSSSLESTYDFNLTVTDDLYLYAKWEKKPTVSFYDLLSDTPDEPFTTRVVTYGEYFQNVTQDVREDPDFPTHEGYVIVGQYLDKECTQPITGTITGDCSVYIKWDKLWTVTFDDGIEGTENETKQVVNGQTVTEPKDPTWDGYEFKGWYDADGALFDFDTPITSDMTLTAKWEKIPVYTVTFDFMLDDMEDIQLTALKDQPIADVPDEVKNPVHEGYEFEGWYFENGAQYYPGVSKTYTDTTVYAEWTPTETPVVTYTVTFDDGTNKNVVEVEEGEIVSKPADPTREGYTFGGWLLDGEAYDFSKPVTSDITLTAKWTENEPEPEPTVFTVTFNDGIDSTKDVTVKVEEGKAVSRPADPTREGYTFGGWFTDAAATKAYDFKSLVKADLTLYAKWTKNVAPEPAETITMWRLYNPYTGEHFYTADKSEYEFLGTIGWIQEDVAWIAPAEGEEVYRLYNPFTSDHHYTMNAEERDKLVALGWNYEGVGWRSASKETGVPLQRLFNPYEIIGTHHYTTSLEERDQMVENGWVYEGTAWYAVSAE